MDKPRATFLRPAGHTVEDFMRRRGLCQNGLLTFRPLVMDKHRQFRRRTLESLRAFFLALRQSKVALLLRSSFDIILFLDIYSMVAASEPLEVSHTYCLND